MKKPARAWAYFLVSILYLLILVPMNITGAKSVEMLYVSRVGGPGGSVISHIDEVPEYGELLGMIRHGATFSESFRNFFTLKGFFYYGWPQYFLANVSIRVLEPVYTFLGGKDVTTFRVFVFRELGVLYLLLACWLVTVVSSRGRVKSWYSRSAFVLTLLVPGVFLNAAWIHPDALVTLSVCATLALFHRDAFRFSRAFTWAGFACGIAIGVKMLGIYFGPTVLLYSGYAWLKLGRPWKRILLADARFVAAMALGFLVSSPFFFWASSRRGWFNAMAIRAQYSTHFNAGLGNALGWETKVMAPYYGSTLLLAALVALLVFRFRRRRNRLWSSLVLSWSVPYCLHLFLAQTWQGYWYLVPPCVAMMSLLNPVEEAAALKRAWASLKPPLLRAFAAAAPALGLIVLLCGFVREDVAQFNAFRNREKDSPSIRFFESKVRPVLESAAARKPGLKVFRDPYVYIPELKDVAVTMKWGPVDYSDLEAGHFDFLVLQRDYIAQLDNPDSCMDFYTPDICDKTVPFYQDLEGRKTRGFRVVSQGPFGLILEATPEAAGSRAR